MRISGGSHPDGRTEAQAHLSFASKTLTLLGHHAGGSAAQPPLQSAGGGEPPGRVAAVLDPDDPRLREARRTAKASGVESKAREAQRLDDRAGKLMKQGQYDAAEPLYERALRIREKALGPGHLDVAQSLNSLAMLYQAKADYARAEPLYERALRIWEKAHGPDPPEIGAILNNLALLYYERGDYARAKPLYERALRINEKRVTLLDLEHPYVANSLSGLAKLYEAEGDYARAEPLFERALRIDEKALGPDHPTVAIILNNLALLYKAEGDDARAEPLFKTALRIREKALGPDHPDTVESRNTLAILRKAQHGVPTEGQTKTVGARKAKSTPVGKPNCPNGMVYIPGGAYTMGQRNNEVTVNSFCLDRTEVTVDAFNACVDAGKCSKPGGASSSPSLTIIGPRENEAANQGAQPVTYVDWDQATAYCEWVGGRLPSEVMWEWAARGGDKGWTYPWGDSAPSNQLCWSGDGWRYSTCSVGSFPSGNNIWGVQDLAGNVAEWTSSSYSSTNSNRVIRGGSFMGHSPSDAMAAERKVNWESSRRFKDVGFRCAKELTP